MMAKKGTICDARGSCPLIRSILKPIFRLIQLIRCANELLRCIGLEIHACMAIFVLTTTMTITTQLIMLAIEKTYHQTAKFSGYTLQHVS